MIGNFQRQAYGARGSALSPVQMAALGRGVPAPVATPSPQVVAISNLAQNTAALQHIVTQGAAAAAALKPGPSSSAAPAVGASAATPIAMTSDGSAQSVARQQAALTAAGFAPVAQSFAAALPSFDASAFGIGMPTLTPPAPDATQDVAVAQAASGRGWWIVGGILLIGASAYGYRRWKGKA